MRTNSKEVKEKVRDYILDVLSCEEIEIKTFAEAKIYIKNKFESEFNHPRNKQLHPNLQDRFMHYCLGLPFNFTTYFKEQREILISFGLIDKGYTDSQVEITYFYLIFKEIFN